MPTPDDQERNAPPGRVWAATGPASGTSVSIFGPGRDVDPIAGTWVAGEGTTRGGPAGPTGSRSRRARSAAFRDMLKQRRRNRDFPEFIELLLLSLAGEGRGSVSSASRQRSLGAPPL